MLWCLHKQLSVSLANKPRNRVSLANKVQHKRKVIKMIAVENLKQILIGGSIITQKSGVQIVDIFEIVDKGCDEFTIGGYTQTLDWNNNVRLTERWTTIQL